MMVLGLQKTATMRRPAEAGFTSTERGFTLMEMMIVVVIIGILAAVAISAYSKWTREAKASEVPHMLGHLQQRELAYQVENGAYLATGADEDDLFPALSDVTAGHPVITGGVPAEWTTLKVQPGTAALHCGYAVLSGEAGDAPDALDDLWNGTQPTRSWFYVVAQCDWDRDGDFEKWRVRGDLGLATTLRENRGE